MSNWINSKLSAVRRVQRVVLFLPLYHTTVAAVKYSSVAPYQKSLVAAKQLPLRVAESPIDTAEMVLFQSIISHAC